MSQSEFNPAPATARAGQVWRTGAGGLYTIPCDINPLGFDLVEMVCDEDGFTIWRGGDQPVAAGALVLVRLRSGTLSNRPSLVSSLRWDHQASTGDIVAYKVVEAAEEFGKVENLRVVIEDVRAGGETVNAIAILEAAAGHMRDRAATYDKPEGERSMAQTVAAFNAITGRELSESEGWLLMDLLKLTRLFAHPGFHRDSAEDHVAYGALLAEARAREAAESLPKD